MSASSTATRLPRLRSASARLAEVVDLPTPPLPDATAMMVFTPGMPWAARAAWALGPGAGAAGACEWPPCEWSCAWP